MNTPVGDVELDYDLSGSGDDAWLLIHGFPFDRSIWDAQAAALAKRFRVVAPDVRGHGRSGGAEGPAAMEDLARDLLGLMDALGIRRFAAAGHSMGGYVLFAMHRIAPERLTAVALVATRAADDAPEARAARLANADRALREGIGFLAESMSERAPASGAGADLRARVRSLILRRSNPAGVAAALRGMAERPDSRPRLASIGVPALVVAGAQDRIVPLEESRALAGAIPGARLVVLERAGHLPMLEAPEETSRALLELV